jgi:hypothetical protein
MQALAYAVGKAQLICFVFLPSGGTLSSRQYRISTKFREVL